MQCENTYDVKEIECAWKKQMQDEVCEKTQDENRNCTNDRAGNLHIQDTCYLMNPTGARGFMHESRDNPFKYAEEARAFTSLPCAAEIPRSR